MRTRLFTAASGLFLVLLSTGSAHAGATAIPEPATLALLAVGVGGLALVRFRRRK